MGYFFRLWIGILGGLGAAILAMPAQAQQNRGTDGGMYWSVRGGLSQVRNGTSHDWFAIEPVYDDVDPSILIFAGIDGHNEWRTLEMDYGYVVGTAIGYTWAYPGHVADVRLELEGIYRKNDDGQLDSDWTVILDLDDAFSLGDEISPIDGFVDVRSAMINVLADFHTQTRFTPYVGVGVGISHLTAKGWIWDFNRAAYADWPFFPTSLEFFNDSIYALSWQAIAGVGFRLTPGTMVTLDFRHFELAADRHSGLFSTDELRDVKFDDVSLGLRLTF